MATTYYGRQVAPYRRQAVVSHPRVAVPPQDALAYSRQQEQFRQLDAAQRADAAAKLEESKQATLEKIAKLKHEQDMAMFGAKTNHQFEVESRKAAAKAKEQDKPELFTLVQDTPHGKLTRKVTQEQFDNLNAKKDWKDKLDLLNQERLVQAAKIFPGGRQVSVIDKEIEDLKKNEPPNLLAKQDLIDKPVVALPPPPLNTKAPTMFNGVTSLTGQNMIPVRGSAFIGDPGEEPGSRNRFVDMSGMVDAPDSPAAWGTPAAAQAPAAAPDLLSSPSFPGGYDPNHGSFQVGAAPAPQAAAMAQQSAPAKGIPNSHIRYLLENPDTAKHFDEFHGEGAAAQILNQDYQP